MHQPSDIYVLINGETTGPYTAAEVKERWKNHQLEGQHLIWWPGMEDWQPLGEVGKAFMPYPAVAATNFTRPNSNLGTAAPSDQKLTWWRKILESLFKYRSVTGKPISFLPHVWATYILVFLGLFAPWKASFILLATGLHLGFVARHAAKGANPRLRMANVGIILGLAIFGLRVLMLATSDTTPVGSPSPPPQVAAAPMWALYSGSCQNLTVNVPGNLKICFSDKAGSLEGYVSISGWLQGSGPLKGRRKGDAFEFITTDHMSGNVIHWQAKRHNHQLIGTYSIPANPKTQMPAQSGEWSVMAGHVGSQHEVFERHFLLACELGLNEPKRTPDGRLFSGAEMLFNTVHPIGTGAGILAEDVHLVWKDNRPSTDLSNLRSFTLDYILYWHGVIQTFGWTRLRLTYDYERGGVTHHEVVESTGTTNSDVDAFAYDLGFFLGHAAMRSLLQRN